MKNMLPTMTTKANTKTNIQSAIYVVLAQLILSLQSVAVKYIGIDYPIMEIVIFRCMTAIPSSILLFRLEGRLGLPTTQRHKLEFVRGIFLFLSYTTSFMGLAALPLADMSALRFSSPLFITFLSVLMLGEKVDLRHWLVLFVGFLGIVIIIKPGSATFNLGSIFILVSMFFYAISVIITRKLQTTDSSATMSFYSSIVYIIAASIFAPLTILVGEIPNAHPSVAFLFRAWSIPTLLDLSIMFGLGLVWASGMYFIARAYSMTQASTVAPFEYFALPINIIWGFIIWQEVPSVITLAGAFLTLLSGLYILYRVQK